MLAPAGQLDIQGRRRLLGAVLTIFVLVSAFAGANSEAARLLGSIGQIAGGISTLSKLAADPNALMKNPNQAVDALKQNLGKGVGNKLPTSNPSELLNDPGKAAEGLKGLLGGAKDNKKKKDKSAE